LNRRRSVQWAALIAACTGSAAVRSAFVDPLDTVAVMNPVAARSGMLTAVSRVDSRSWVAVGRRGLIVSSGDGQSWKQVVCPVGTDLVGVYFRDARQGWAVGHGGVILATTDAGNTWSKQLDGRRAAEMLVEHYSRLAAGSATSQEDLADARRFVKSGPGRPFLDVWFADDRRGYAIGAFNLLFATIDGGKTWTPQPGLIANDKKLHLVAIRAVGADAYIVGEQGLMARMGTGGERFETIALPYSGSFFGLIGKSNLLLAFGLQGILYRSKDRGARWEMVETGVQSTITSGAITDDGRIVLGTQGGALLVSADGADRFATLQPKDVVPIYGLAAAGADAVIVVGARGAIRVPLSSS
jgi:photosystem II stability/assembly factor-like uncharacterized protein